MKNKIIITKRKKIEIINNNKIIKTQIRPFPNSCFSEFQKKNPRITKKNACMHDGGGEEEEARSRQPPTVPWQMVRKPFFTEHFLFCHTFLSLEETTSHVITARSYQTTFQRLGSAIQLPFFLSFDFKNRAIIIIVNS